MGRRLGGNGSGFVLAARLFYSLAKRVHVLHPSNHPETSAMPVMSQGSSDRKCARVRLVECESV